MIELYGHPFAAFVWKALIAAYERDVPFTFQVVDAEHPEHRARIAELSPTGQFPALVDGTCEVTGSNAVIAYLDRFGKAAPMMPADPDAAIEARMLGDVFDDYVLAPMNRIVAECFRGEGEKAPYGVADARSVIERAYVWLDRRLAVPWAAGATFTIADCAAAPALFYADWVHVIPETAPKLRAYRARLLARPSVTRVVNEARPYRHLFPPRRPKSRLSTYAANRPPDRAWRCSRREFRVHSYWQSAMFYLLSHYTDALALALALALGLGRRRRSILRRRSGKGSRIPPSAYSPTGADRRTSLSSREREERLRSFLRRPYKNRE